MPSEDYYRTTIIQAIGKALDVSTPMIDTLLHRYADYCERYQIEHPQQSVSSQFNLDDFEEDISLVTTYLANKL